MKVVISGYYGFGNFGDEAILGVLTDRLKHLNAEIVVLSSDPRKTSMDYYVNSVNSFDFLHVKGVIKNSEVLISGGGSLLQDVTSLKSLIYYLWVILTALWYRKKVIIFAQGIGPINNPLARFLTAKILKHCTYVSVRDENSKKMLDTMGIDAVLLCDPIFSLKLPKSSDRGVVGVQLRKCRSLDESLLDKLSGRIVRNFLGKKIEIYSLQKSLDYEVCKMFEEKLRKLNPDIVTEIVSDNIIQRISNLEFMIAMRFHALIIAMKTGVKCAGINYDIKVEKLCRQANIPLISMDAHENFEEIFDELNYVDADSLKAYADSNCFDWSGIESIIK